MGEQVNYTIEIDNDATKEKIRLATPIPDGIINHQITLPELTGINEVFAPQKFAAALGKVNLDKDISNLGTEKTLYINIDPLLGFMLKLKNGDSNLKDILIHLMNITNARFKIIFITDLNHTSAAKKLAKKGWGYTELQHATETVDSSSDDLEEAGESSGNDFSAIVQASADPPPNVAITLSQQTVRPIKLHLENSWVITTDPTFAKLLTGRGLDNFHVHNVLSDNTLDEITLNSVALIPILRTTLETKPENIKTLYIDLGEHLDNNLQVRNFDSGNGSDIKHILDRMKEQNIKIYFLTDNPKKLLENPVIARWPITAAVERTPSIARMQGHFIAIDAAAKQEQMAPSMFLGTLFSIKKHCPVISAAAQPHKNSGPTA